MMTSPFAVTAFVHHPPTYNHRSGMYPLAEALGARTVFYTDRWRQIQRHSWRLGAWARRQAVSWYGSQWTYLLPLLDEWRMAQRMARCDVAHFLFGEFAAPRHAHGFRKKARALVGTFHASARRLPNVLKGYRCLATFDAVTLMSETQRPYFEKQGVPADKLTVILHGVDTGYFTPALNRSARPEEPLRGLLVGSTERDHEMMNNILHRLPDGILDLTILTATEQRQYYYPKNVPHATFPEHMDDASLLEAYRAADLLIMPMLDCTANNAVLEAMACGTPVMANRIGGIPEYVDSSCNVVLDEHSADAWVDLLVYWYERRDQLEAMRPRVRQWAERFDWAKVAPRYLAAYEKALTMAS